MTLAKQWDCMMGLHIDDAIIDAEDMIKSLQKEKETLCDTLGMWENDLNDDKYCYMLDNVYDINTEIIDSEIDELEELIAELHDRKGEDSYL